MFYFVSTILEKKGFDSVLSDTGAESNNITLNSCNLAPGLTYKFI